MIYTEPVRAHFIVSSLRYDFPLHAVRANMYPRYAIVAGNYCSDNNNDDSTVARAEGRVCAARVTRRPCAE